MLQRGEEKCYKFKACLFLEYIKESQDLRLKKNLTNGQWPIYSANMFVVRDTKARGMKNALKNYCSEFRMPPTARKTKLKFLLY